MGDIVFVNGRTMLRSRAIALGLIASDGVAVLAVAAATASSLPKPKIGRPVGSKNKAKVDPTDAIDLPVKPIRIEPLRPQNVDHSGIPIMEADVLADIIKRTEELDAARAAKSDGKA